MKFRNPQQPGKSEHACITLYSNVVIPELNLLVGCSWGNVGIIYGDILAVEISSKSARRVWHIFLDPPKLNSLISQVHFFFFGNQVKRERAEREALGAQPLYQRTLPWVLITKPSAFTREFRNKGGGYLDGLSSAHSLANSICPAYGSLYSQNIFLYVDQQEA